MTALARMEKRPNHAEVSVQIADQILAQEKNAEARSNLLYQRARAYAALGKPKLAVADYEEALKLNSLHLASRTGLAETLEFTGDVDGALKVYAKTAERFPREPLVFNNRGMLYQRQNRHREAIADFTRAISFNRRYIVAYTNRGFSNLLTGNATAADQDFTRSIELNANQPMTYSLRGLARMVQGRIADGVKDHEVHTRLAPNSPDAWTELGFARSFAGDSSGAAESFAKAFELDSNRQFLAPWHFRALAGAGYKDQAQQKYAEAMSKADWNSRLLSYVAGKLDDGTLLSEVQNSAAKVKPARLCEAHYFIGVDALQSGNSDEAKTHFQSAVQTGQAQLSAYRGALVALRQMQTRTQ